MSDEKVPVLAVYDFRSKQEFIYRTNRMREITGASELMAGMYDEFLKCEELKKLGSIRDDWDAASPSDVFDEDGEATFGADEIGIVIYEGGGNLCVLYRDRNWYVKANRVFSRLILENAYSLSLVTGCAPWKATGKPDDDFDFARKRAYQALDVKKRTGSVGIPCNVLPFNQVDAVTYQPIIEKGWKGADRVELSRESVCKLAAFDKKAQADSKWGDQGKFIDRIGTSKGEDSLIAVVYFDGNSIGDRLKGVHGLKQMRAFSTEVHDTLVTKTKEAMIKAITSMPDERQRDYRIIIDHGDEITLVCNAHAAPVAIGAYYEALQKANEELGQKNGGYLYRACAGMAICHAHDPFSEVYRIAEECCESGKEHNRAAQNNNEPNSNWIDFHYCRSGITGSLAQIRETQENVLTCRPYRFDTSYAKFCAMGAYLSSDNCKIKRSDLKELARAILRGDLWYGLEYERLRAKDMSTMGSIAKEWLGAGADTKSAETRDKLKKPLFDLASFFDIFDVHFSMLAVQLENGDSNE